MTLSHSRTLFARNRWQLSRVSLDRLLAGFDPLLRRPALIVKSHYRPAVHLEIGHDETHAGKQFPKVKLDFRQCRPGDGFPRPRPHPSAGGAVARPECTLGGLTCEES